MSLVVGLAGCVSVTPTVAPAPADPMPAADCRALADQLYLTDFSISNGPFWRLSASGQRCVVRDDDLLVWPAWHGGVLDDAR